ncbi:flagellar basal body protein FliL [Sphingomonas aracearum]|uniref:Flagellar protein FliL n=2 Tax=Sphingomonas aracearum TaxID=2283317 RepID=A0A369W1F2_9SPHN|nr:flagellar basal body-associated FliL family protein [Sphingomonas aracearum]RDE05901.1 flagellar basal body protein FliL [Sphingomonas aracearum]
MSDAKEEAPKKKGGAMKFVLIGVGALVLVAGSAAGAVFAMGGLGGGHHAEAEEYGPKLVPKSEQKRAAAGEGGEGHGEGGGSGSDWTPPPGSGGDKYASNYYAMEKEFTSNLQDSVHFVQVGLAVSTPYDDSVIENLKTNEIAVRSAVLLALGDTTEEQVFSSNGKEQLQKRLTTAINATLKQKEGFGGISNVYFTNFVVQ